MSRITACFARLHAQGRKALIPYVTAGYPALDSTVELMHAMVAAGADIIELGMPFSDPSADGPAIQRANEQALRQGVGLVQVLACVREFRQRDSTTPVVLMGYANPIERYDFLREQGAFARDAAVAGVDGMLVLDYPPLACEGFAQQLRQHGLDLIFLLAPTSTPERIRQVASMATGYVYCVSIKGVTGAHALDVAEVQARLASLRADIPIPLGVGFGIRDADTAKALAGSADAVIIGSRLIELLADGAPDLGRQAVVTWLEGVRAALDGRA